MDIVVRQYASPLHRHTEVVHFLCICEHENVHPPLDTGPGSFRIGNQDRGDLIECDRLK